MCNVLDACIVCIVCIACIVCTVCIVCIVLNEYGECDGERGEYAFCGWRVECGESGLFPDVGVCGGVRGGVGGEMGAGVLCDVILSNNFDRQSGAGESGGIDSTLR